MRGTSSSPTKLLLIENDETDVLLFSRMLSECSGSFQLNVCDTLDAALRWLEEFECDIVLSDMSLPDTFGLEGITKIQERFPHLPIVMMTGLDDDEVALDALDLGAQDYLLKGDTTPRELKRTIRYAIQRKLIQCENARLVEKLKLAARMDALTGVLNRHAMLSEFEKHWAQACENQTPLSCVILDVDFFKRVNDEFGHVIGDKVLQRVAKLISTQMRCGDSIARYGGEEFCVILVDADEDVAAQWADRVRQRLAESPFQIPEGTIQITASFGVAHRCGETKTVEHLIDAADHALLEAKHDGRNRVARYSANAKRIAGDSGNSLLDLNALSICPVI
ncbi:GGDEF domain-containing response regulator [Rhodopirellula sallentina]|uniref:diguanylate cyclase n=1 Tax=Rhodopirellula sallentina SM41 TaxID=1263870 RepID=M5U2T5_9BACT|nr:diguanylate cyclase [Rhodopirellula sallentina]EMI52171.1 response regulator receiver modulated diguanylate cyclase [Rhodopirellula sallentina SM41]